MTALQFRNLATLGHTIEHQVSQLLLSGLIIVLLV